VLLAELLDVWFVLVVALVDVWPTLVVTVCASRRSATTPAWSCRRPRRSRWDWPAVCVVVTASDTVVVLIPCADTGT